MTDKLEGTITITTKEYNRLLESDTWLMCLESAGVDNWEGLSYAYELAEEIEGQDDE